MLLQPRVRAWRSSTALTWAVASLTRTTVAQWGSFSSTTGPRISTVLLFFFCSLLLLSLVVSLYLSFVGTKFFWCCGQFALSPSFFFAGD